MTGRGSRKLRLATMAAGAIGLAACVAAAHGAGNGPKRAGERPPNVIILYADDLGYGDVGAYGARRIPTPNIDALAAEGLRFTDGYAAAATCTPSRYALLTGEYGFRSHAEILPGDAPALIRPGKPTIASTLKQRGYATAVIGKWHLGLGTGKVDWNKDVAPGPLEIGFDYSFLLPSTLDRVPTVYLENHRVVGLDPADPLQISYKEPIGNRPVGREHPELLRYKADKQHSDTIINGVSRIGYMQGGKSAEWVDEEIHSVVTDKALGFIRTNRDKPFFLYLPLPEPHVPRMPGKRFSGATDLGPRGDAVVELDWIVGQVTGELRRLGLAENTLIVFSSDNGPVLNDGYDDGAAERTGDHRPGGPLRGGKYSTFDAGTRVPLIAWWPGQIRPGVSHALLSQVDLFASLAALAGVKLPDTVAIDSENLLPTWLGKSQKGRHELFIEAVTGFALREGAFKYIPPMRNPQQATFVAQKGIESGGNSGPQLYNLAADLGESRNLAGTRPRDVSRMDAGLHRIEMRTRANRK